MKGEHDGGLMMEGLDARQKALKRLFHGARKPLGFLIICLVVLVANVAMIHRFACANEETNLSMMESSVNWQSRLADDDGHKKRKQQQRPPSGNHHDGTRTQQKSDTDAGRDHQKRKDSISKAQETKHESMAACLLIKDDNDILNEWLAYHYHAIKLRHLVVAVDPSSEESPQNILDRWTNLTNLSVELWSDGDFMPQEFLEKGYHKPPNEISGDAKTSQWHEGHEDPEQVIADNMKILNHRYRQVTFLSRCLGHLKQLKKKWVMHVDTDEFVVVNPLLRNSTQENVQHLHIRDIKEPSSVLKLLQDLNADYDIQAKMNHPCISMPRLLFGSVEHQSEAVFNPHFNTTLFETNRWLHHTNFEDKDRNAQPKVIVDVSTVAGKDEMFRKPFSIHRPSRRLCRGVNQLKFSQLQRYPITVNHYTGSWERYNSKNDTRRSRRTYGKKAFVEDGYDRWITPWLEGFIQEHGLNLTRELLADYVI